jgi:WD40 repeat protein
VKVLRGKKDFSIRLWDAQTGTEIGSPLSVDSGTYDVRSMSYSPAGVSPAGDMSTLGCDNGKIHLLDTATFAVKRLLRGHSKYVTGVSYSCLLSNVLCADY